MASTTTIVGSVAKLPKLWQYQQGLIEFLQSGIDIQNDVIPGGGITGETISRAILTVSLYVQKRNSSAFTIPHCDVTFGLYNGQSITPDPLQHNLEPRSWWFIDRMRYPVLTEYTVSLTSPNERYYLGSMARQYDLEGQRAQGGLHATFRFAARKNLDSMDSDEIWSIGWSIRFLKTLHPD